MKHLGSPWPVWLATALLALGLPATSLGDGILARGNRLREAIRELGHSDEATRQRAAERLARLGDSAAPARSALEKLLREYGADDSGNAAVLTLGRIGAKALPALIWALAIPDDHQRLASSLASAFAAIGGSAVAPLARALIESPSPLARERAAAAIGQVEGGAGAARSALERALGDGEEAVRAAAVLALGAAGELAIPALIRALGDRDEGPRQAAASELGGIGRLAIPALPSLRKLLAKSPSADTRRAAAESLGKIAAGTKEVVYSLEIALGDRSDGVRAAAALALSGSGRPAVAALTRGLADRSEEVRNAVARSLAEIGKPARPALPALRRACEDRSEKVRCEALDAVASIDAGGATARALLVAALGDPENEVVRTAAAQLAAWQGPGSTSALASVQRTLARQDLDGDSRESLVAALAAIAPRPGQALPLLRQALRDEHRAARSAAARAIGELGGDGAPAVDELARLLGDPDHDEATVAAARALGQIGPRAAKAVPRLERALDHGLLEVRQEAATALGAIGRGAAGARRALERVVLEETALEIRRAAAVALGEIGPDLGSTRILLRLLSDRSLRLRAAAAQSLGELRCGAAMAKIEAAARAERIPIPTAVGALVAIRGNGIGALGRLLSHSLPEARQAAALALTSLGASARAQLPALQRAAADRDPGVRLAVEAAIASVSGFTAGALSAH